MFITVFFIFYPYLYGEEFYQIKFGCINNNR